MHDDLAAEMAAIHAYEDEHGTCDIQQHPWTAVFGAAWTAGRDFERQQAQAERERLRQALQNELATLLGDITVLTAGMEQEKKARYLNCERVERIRSALGIAALSEQPRAGGEPAA